MIRFGQAHQAEGVIHGKGKMPYKMNDWKNLSAECGGGTLNHKTISYASFLENGSPQSTIVSPN